MRRILRRPRSRVRLAQLVAALTALAAPLQAQGAQRFDTGIVVGGDWLQANALPLDRDALHSVALTASLRRQVWSVDAGWLRVARSLSTVQGGTISGGPLLHWRRLLIIPAVGILGGQAQESRDSTGYDFVAANGVTGHQPRYTHSTAGTFGGGVSLTLETPIYRAVGIRAAASQWYFSGAPLEGDRARTLLGAGLSFRLGR